MRTLGNTHATLASASFTIEFLYIFFVVLWATVPIPSAPRPDTVVDMFFGSFCFGSLHLLDHLFEHISKTSKLFAATYTALLANR